MICTVDDDFVADLPRWVAELTDGTVAYRDDDRPGASPPQAWIRLADHCRGRGLAIRRLCVQFRSNVVPVDLAGAAGAYCLRGGVARLEDDDASGAGTLTIGLVGAGGATRATRYELPHLEVLEESESPGPPGLAIVIPVSL